MNERDALKLEIGNVLREQLPILVPGLTKLAYDQIIDDAIAALPESKEDLEKDAGLSFLPSSAQLGSAVNSGIVEAVSKAIPAVAIATLGGAALYGINKAVNAISNSSLHSSFSQALDHAINSQDRAGEILRSHDRKKVVSFAETIFKYAPNISIDANLLKSVLSEAVYGDSISPGTIKALMELEEKKKNIGQWKPQDLLIKG